MIALRLCCDSNATGSRFRQVAVAENMPLCITLSDICISGSPLVYINQRFRDWTGYGCDEALGRNCRFLQGPATDLRAVMLYLGPHR